jgi:hypothetical protein
LAIVIGRLLKNSQDGALWPLEAQRLCHALLTANMERPWVSCLSV